MVDYSKWDNIDISDAEEAHPAEGPSFPREKHQTQDEKLQKHNKEIEHYQNRKDDYHKRIFETKEKILKLQQVLKELEEQNEINEKLGEKLMKKKQKSLAENATTNNKPGFSKKKINASSRNPNLSKKFGFTNLNTMTAHTFFIKHEKELKHYGMLSEYEDSRAYLKAHSYLLCEDSIFSLMSWCSELKMEQKHDLIECVLHQATCIQHVLDAARALNWEPVACVDKFFAKFQDRVFREWHQHIAKELTKDMVDRSHIELLKNLEGFDSLKVTVGSESDTEVHKMTFVRKD